MSAIRRLKGSLLTGALALAIGAQANAALLVNDALEGAWYNAAESGRGAMVDYIPTGPGTGVLFITIFTYDANNNPLWVTTQTLVNEGEFKWSNLPVLRFTGGSFGSPFTAPSNAALGTAAVTFNSCSDLRISFTPAAGTTLPATSYTFDRPGAVPKTCVYTQPFAACPTGTTAVAGAADLARLFAERLQGLAGPQRALAAWQLARDTLEANMARKVEPGACHKGCAWCCNFQVTVRFADAAQLARRARAEPELEAKVRDGKAAEEGRDATKKIRLIEFLGVIALLLVFEFLNLLLHPMLVKITHHSPVQMLLALVGGVEQGHALPAGLRFVAVGGGQSAPHDLRESQL